MTKTKGRWVEFSISDTPYAAELRKLGVTKIKFEPNKNHKHIRILITFHNTKIPIGQNTEAEVTTRYLKALHYLRQHLKTIKQQLLNQQTP